MMDPGEDVAQPGVRGWLSGFVRSDNSGRVFYGWRLVAVGFLVILVGRQLGETGALTAYSAHLREYVGDGLEWYSVVTLVGGAAGLLALPFLGSAIDRIGPRRVVRIGLALVGVTVLLTAVPVRGIQVLALTSTGGLGLVGIYLPTITTLNHWFRRRLVVALAALFFAVAIAAAIVDFAVPLLADVVDWRIVMVAVGLIVLAATPVLSRAARDHPEDSGERPDGLGAAPDLSIPNYAWREALQSGQFWMLAAAICCTSAVESIAHVYATPAIVDRGVVFDTVRDIRGLDSYLTIPFILAGGLLGYRWPIRYVLSGAAIATAIGIGMMFIGHMLEFIIATLLLAAASGASVAPGIAAVGNYFGRRNFAAITATIFLLHYLAAFPLLPTVGWLWGVGLGGSVFLAIASAALSLIGAGLFFRMGQPRLSPTQMAANSSIS